MKQFSVYTPLLWCVFPSWILTNILPFVNSQLVRFGMKQSPFREHRTSHQRENSNRRLWSIVLIARQIFFPETLKTALSIKSHFHSHRTGGAQRGWAACLERHSPILTKLGFELIWAWFQTLCPFLVFVDILNTLSAPDKLIRTRRIRLAEDPSSVLSRALLVSRSSYCSTTSRLAENTRNLLPPSSGDHVPFKAL